jgi:hypothetical protein
MFGVVNRIRDEAPEQFQENHVFGFPDYDSVGITGMTRWRGQLKGISPKFWKAPLRR